MTVASTQSKIVHITDGVSTSFAVPFRFLHASHLRVTEARGGTETVLTSGMQYSVVGANQPQGGSVITTTALAADAKLVIERIVPLTQEIQYPRNDPFPARAHEQALDKLTMIDQQHAEMLSRAVILPVSSTQTSDQFLNSLFAAETNAAASAAAAGQSAVQAASSAWYAASSASQAQISASGAATSAASANTAAHSAQISYENVAQLIATIPDSPFLFVHTDNGFSTVYVTGGFDMGALTVSAPFFNESLPHPASMSVGSAAFDFGGLA